VLTHIRDVHGSILAGLSVILTEVFGSFPQSLQANSGARPRLEKDRFFLSNNFQSLLISHSTIRPSVVERLRGQLKNSQKRILIVVLNLTGYTIPSDFYD
jgi:hypothetical protein